MASGSRALSAPKKVRTGRSKNRTMAHAGMVTSTEPMRAAVKNSFSPPSPGSPPSPPRRALNSTEPPMPMSRPKLYTMFHTGATTARAAVPSGP